MSDTIYTAITFATNTEDTARVAALPTNQYMDTYKSNIQKEVLHSLTGESIHKNGQEMIYLIRDTQNIDLIFGEDPTNSFSKSFRFAIYVQSTDGIGGEEFNYYGYAAKHGIDCLIEPKLFHYQVPDLAEPRAGDLVYWPTAKILYEVAWVDNDDGGLPFYMNGTLPQRKMILKKFIYSGEAITTTNNSIYENIDPLTLVNATWSRAGAVITVTHNGHGFDPADLLYVQTTSDALSMDLGDTIVTTSTINTFTFNGLNAGGVTGTMSYYPNPNNVQFSFPDIDSLSGTTDDYIAPNEATQVQTTSDADITAVIDEMNPFGISI